MTATVEEQRLGGLRWIVLRGPGPETFSALGDHLRAEIRAVLTDWEYLDRLRWHATGPLGSERLAAVRHASETTFPGVWAELAALADGAGVALADLALLNFRGDLGVIGSDPPGDGTGCSDLAWRRHRSFIAHNEDDADFFDGRCAMLTLALDGRQPVTAFWKPGFLPSTTITATASGLAWAIDHLPTASPGGHAGRHFVARGLQHTAASIDQAIGFLRGHPSAGGFAYMIGDPAGRVVSLEASAGQHAVREVGGGGPLAWHTNHGRYLAGADADPSGTSLLRGQILQALDEPAGEPDAGWFARILAGAAPPAGVRADSSPASPAMTLCTFIANLTTGDATVVRAGTGAVTIPLADLARGRADTQRPVATPVLPSPDPYATPAAPNPRR